MNIRFLKNYNESNSILIDDSNILETTYTKSKYGYFNNVKYFIYDTLSNERYEIMPKIYKLDGIRIVNGEFNSKKIFFVQYLPSDEDINIIAYDYINRKSNIIYSLKSSLSELCDNRRISIFVLNENYFIYQTEFLRNGLENSYKGYFNYESFLYNIKEQKEITIVDDNLINNGISNIYPLKDNFCVLKLGYNLLEDKRFKFISKMEASVESVNIANIAQLVSDLMISQNGIILNSIDQAFYSQTIPRVFVEDDYIVYSKFDLTNMNELTTFYNYNAKDSYGCVNKGYTKTGKFTKALLINNKPYVMLGQSSKYDFYNLLTQNVDFSLHKDREINTIAHDIFILTETKKAIFGSNKKYICVYRYPNMESVHSEKGVYTGSLYNYTTDTLFIFIK